MSRKLKFALGGLLLLAAFFVFRAGSYLAQTLKNNSNQTASILSAASTPVQSTILKDTDADGIPDEEEVYSGTDTFKADSDGDGYLDGEEVVSQYDPTLKGDDNTRKPKNLTDLFTQRLIAGIAAGDLDPKNGKGTAYQQGLSMISASIIGEADSMFTEGTVATKIHIVPNTEQSLSDYSTALQAILDDKALTDAFTAQADQVDKAFSLMADGKSAEGVAILKNYQKLFQTKQQQLAITPVPQAFASFHKIFVARFGELGNIYESLAMSEDDEMLQSIAGQRLAAAIVGLKKDLLDAFMAMLSTKPKK